MKRTLTVVALTVLVWSCSKKSTPTASNVGTSANSGSVVNAPAANTGAVAATANPAAAAVVPSTPAGTRSPADGGATKSPEMLGQSTFNAKCGRCHGLKVTTDYTVERWVSVMQDMARRANLSDTEKENVLAYVKANAKK